jgi:hypothetical protein
VLIESNRTLGGVGGGYLVILQNKNAIKPDVPAAAARGLASNKAGEVLSSLRSQEWLGRCFLHKMRQTPVTETPCLK